MPKLIDLTGRRFDRLVVIRRDGTNKHNQVVWLCQCVCGNEVKIAGDSLRDGRTKSCGCLRKEVNTKHGHRTTKIYRSWSQMIQRCTNPSYNKYLYYGGRGISICEHWIKFENFLEDMGENWKPGLQIDRIDNDKGYYKENCRWVTSKEQQRNRRNNRLITYKERIQCLSAWSEELGINYDKLYQRLYKLNWSIEKAFAIP